MPNSRQQAQAELGAGSVAALLRARSDVESALKLDPAHLKSQHRLALALAKLRQPRAALQVLKAISAEAHTPATRNLLKKTQIWFGQALGRYDVASITKMLSREHAIP